MRKGYTLIEILAAIVIMAIIFTIAVPIVNTVIETSRRESFRVSVTNIGRASDLTYSSETMKNPILGDLIFTYDENGENSNVSGLSINYTGERPSFGNIVINQNGQLAISLHNGIYCATKEFKDESVAVDTRPLSTCIREMHLPQIFLVGSSEVDVEVNTPYVDEYATALTSLGEETSNITTAILYDGDVVSSVDTSILGEYLIYYTVREDSKTSSIYRRVNVVDTEAPSIITPGDVTITVDEVTGFNVMAGVVATDNSLETISVTASGSLSRLPGSYIITYRASDSSTNQTVVTRAINVIDVSAPVITLVGSNPINLNVGESYIEYGATALDDIDEDLTSQITTNGSINSNIKGTQYIIYTVKDSSNNEANLARTVNIIDNVAPVISFGTNGNSTYAKTRGTTVTVTDAHSSISTLRYAWTTATTAPATFSTSFTNGSMLSSPAGVSGNYYLWIEAVDAEGNTNVLRTNVFRLDNSLPTITTPGNTTLVINQVAGYNLLNGVTVTDNSGEALSIGVTGNIAAIPGNYTITYSATDSSGNARSVTRTITIQDVSAPVITLLGSNPINLLVGQTYTEAGATALDDVDGNMTASIVTTGTVNTAAVGTYTRTYTVTDSSGNVGTATRTVNVADNIAPTVVFGTNGNATYGRIRSTTVTVSDAHSGVLSRHYVWTTSTTAPTAASISTAFANGATLTTPAGVTGTYYLWIKAIDNASNQTITRTNVFNLDNTIPVITRTGSASVSITLGGTYTEAGATATDNINGTITGSIVTSGSVNNRIAGTYTITYNVSDSSGNAATPVTRTVTVNPITEYRYRDSYSSCDTCYNTCQNSQGASISYSCSSGWSLSGSTCYRSTTSAASVTYSCSTGSLVGSSCYTPTTIGATPSYSCPAGYTRSGTTCSKTDTTTASSYYYCSSGTLDGSGCWSIVSQGGSCGSPHCCPVGYATADGGTCAKKIGNASIGYSCPSGYTRSGTTCSKTTTTTATTSYSCSSGWYLTGGTQCYQNVQTAATPSYSCSSGCSRSGTTCTCNESQSASSSYSCPGGWSLSGSTCYSSYSCNPYSCNCSNYWGGWSAWSTTPVSGSGSREVETRQITSI